MSVPTEVELPIPGTYMFDGRAAMKGYALNKMCYSFNSKENRDQFLAHACGDLANGEPRVCLERRERLEDSIERR